ncbi:hypothetical protein AB4Y32_30960 [Paraburkholderia phymatum]|uniref:Uncharacterized protein n=1 Tax=Paraburkholderia phymatum TaxID=148447 RepID=A0ACC6U930_9BURK
MLIFFLSIHAPDDNWQEGNMSPELLFRLHLVLGYVTWLPCFGVYVWPRLKSMDPLEAQRAIATLHSFRFFGLAFILPGVVSPDLPASFAMFAAYGDFATGVLALLALLTARIRPFFWSFVVPSILWGRSTSSSTTTTLPWPIYLRVRESWAPCTRFRSSTCPCWRLRMLPPSISCCDDSPRRFEATGRSVSHEISKAQLASGRWR